MKNTQFPTKAFREALQVKKLKPALKPFLEEYTKLNMQWMFESILIIVSNLNSQKIEPKTKLASVYTVKHMIETGIYPLISLIEAYILPILKKVAIFSPQQDDEIRGDTYFTKNKGDAEINRIGYNFVRLCTQMILILSLMKPKKLYDLQPTQDPSEFTLAKKQILTFIKNPPQKFMIFKAPGDSKALFEKQMSDFDDNKIDIYTKYVEGIFLDQLKNGFSNKKELDIRTLVLRCDNLLLDLSLQLCQQALEKSSYCKIAGAVFQFVTDAIKTGYVRVLAMLHNNKQISQFVKEIINIPDPSPELARGIHFLKNKKGTPEERQHTYTVFLTSLQFWAKTDAGKSFKDPCKPSPIALYYQLLKNKKKYVFPKNSQLRNQLAQYEKKRKYFKDMNKLTYQEYAESLPEQEMISEIARMKAPKTWSVISESPRNSPEVKKESEKMIKVEEKQVSEKKISETKVEQKKVQSEKLIQKKQTPKPPSDTPEGEQQLTSASFRRYIINLRKIILNLHKEQDALPQKIDYLTEASQGLEGKLEEIPDATEEEVDQYLSLVFDTIDAINELNTAYNKYKKATINFSQFNKEAKGIQENYNIVVEEQPQVEQKTIEKKEQKLPELKIEEVKKQSKKQIQKMQKKEEKKDSKVSSQKEMQKVESRQQIKKEQKKQAEKIQKRETIQVEKKKQQIIPEIKQQKKSKPAQNSEIQEKIEKIPTKKSEIELSPENKQKIGSKKSIQEPSFHSQKHSIPKIQGNETVQRKSTHQQNKENSQQRQKNGKIDFIEFNGQKVEFENSSVGEASRFQSKVDHSKQKQQPGSLLQNLSIQISEVNEEFDNIEQKQIYSKRKLFKEEAVSRIGGMNKVQSEIAGNSHIKLETPFRKKSSQQIPSLQIDLPVEDGIDEDEIIQEPDLMPLDYSFHQTYRQQPKKNFASFRQAIAGEKATARKIGKKQKMFWLKSETESIMKPAANTNQRSRVTSRISVPQILEERTKKHQVEIKMLEEDRDRRVRELKQKLLRVEQQKSSISLKLHEREDEIKTLKQRSNISSRNTLNQQELNYMEDRDYVMKKLGSANDTYSRKKDDFNRNKSYSVLKNQGTLINTRPYHKYFTQFQNEKQKKMHLKSKQLMHKDDNIEIGCMGNLQKDTYNLMCFITPEKDMILEKVGVESDESNLFIKHSFQNEIEIKKRKQEKIHFRIDIKNVPYKIPYAIFHYRMINKLERLRVFLPVGLHKFVRIIDMNTGIFDEHFRANPIQRGEQIPYSKRALKNIDNLQDYLPHIRKITSKQTNSTGQIIYGGQAIFKRVRFLIKIFVKPNQFLYVQIVNHDKDNSQIFKETTQFYVATINHFLMKDISWQ